ncbi:uncharacterized protein LOC129613123 [Condylostylus longicornis]|uniref:uncharacterized protein LOC129613123 n=1 Tax=Condylostylus longicornis TaxID=2530218 RepID=UPI00244DCE22|nr:uncharacterized protein LOC129613123 [Condylostylus longicornis]
MAVQTGRLLLRIVELAVAIGCIALVETKGIILPRQMLTCGTFVGFTIICAVLVLGHIISSPLDKRVDMLISIGGVILFIATGAVIIDAFKDTTTIFGVGKEYKDYALATGGLAIIDAVVFLIDIFITFRS